MPTRTAYRTCPLCEACCGLEITLRREPDGTEQVTRIRGDRDDVASHGFLCPKGTTLGKLHDDPDRLRRPLVRRDGVHVEVSWDEAWQVVADGLHGVQARHGTGAVGVYLGNPTAHNVSSMAYTAPFVRSLRTRQVYSASTVDQRPKEIAASLMFGAFSVPLPDVDRSDLLVCLGANPFDSNGSFATAADWPGRIEALVERGGRFVVIDPRRTKTAEAATEWLPIRPGTDAMLLAAIVHVLVDRQLVTLGRADGYVEGLDELAAAVAPFTPHAVAPHTGIDAATIEQLAADLAATPAAAVYGRIGTTTQAFGTVASWLVDVVNILAGNLDRPGGVMFAKPATGSPNTRGTAGTGRGAKLSERTSRVRALPETFGELPAATLADEITTAGEGAVRALITVAGNPVLSLPNSNKLDAALGELEFMISVDIYLNETTRHADVILPAPSALQKPHYDIALMQLALRNTANWSEAVLPLDDGQLDEWEILGRIALIAQGASAAADPAEFDEAAYGALAAKLDEHDREAIAASGRTGPARIVDAMLRTGPYDLTLDDLVEHPHGVDLGELQPRMPEVLRTPTGKIDLAPEVLVADLGRAAASLALAPERVDATQFLLIGRRDLRSNNSWMHNIPVLVKGRPRCTLQLHPEDAAALGLTDGAPAEVRSRVGSITAPVELFEGITPGVACLPHGWGHSKPGTRTRVAAEHAGVNTNVLTDDEHLEPITGTAVLSGIPVTITRAR